MAKAAYTGTYVGESGTVTISLLPGIQFPAGQAVDLTEAQARLAVRSSSIQVTGFSDDELKGMGLTDERLRELFPLAPNDVVMDDTVEVTE